VNTKYGNIGEIKGLQNGNYQHLGKTPKHANKACFGVFDWQKVCGA